MSLRELTQDIDFCKTALSEGAKIQRYEEWYWTSNSGKTDYETSSFIDIKTKPRWNAQGGYRVNPECYWWQHRKTVEFYESRL